MAGIPMSVEATAMELGRRETVEGPHYEMEGHVCDCECPACEPWRWSATAREGE